jgi:NAD(P)-dependent dehydrogenase (short-subunit alcohol dehydrogenase family)
MGLADLTRMAARELGPDIRVNGVCPGLILEPPGADAGYLERLASHIPLRRRGGVEDVVSAVLYLVEQEFVTGEILFVDGGEKLL